MQKSQELQKFFARGAEAKLYLSKLLGLPVLVKERANKQYRAKELDDQIRKSRTRNEARVMLRAIVAGINVPKLLSVGEYSIHMQKIEGKRLREAKLNTAKSKQVFKSAGEMLAKLHAAGIVHGDFTPANIILSKKGLYLIDFGLASLSNELEDKAVDVLLMEKSISSKEFTYFLNGYKKSKELKSILGRMQEIKKRGRYQIRTED
jgi:Kae1-associated kinase Bud32